jgi:hypothetical protein
VCEWASRDATIGGVGLSNGSVDILRREEIKGSSLFQLTDEALKEGGMPLGARIDLLAAVALLQEPQGTHERTCNSVVYMHLHCLISLHSLSAIGGAVPS